MLDAQILDAAIQSRQAYERVEKYVTAKELSPHVGFWWRLVSEYYGRDRKAELVDRAVLRQLGEAQIKNPKHRDAILNALPDSSGSGSPANVVSAVLGLLRTNRAAEFASAALGGDSAKATGLLETVNDLWQKETLDDEEERIYAKPVAELFSVVGSEKRIPVIPQALNIRLGGGVLRGHHIVVFGRTEIGKSCFVLNLMAGFVKQKCKVLYIGNEDEINITKSRFLCRVTNRTAQEVDQNRADAARVFIQRGGEEYTRFVHMQPGTVEAIAAEVEDYRPAVLILDQIRNLASDDDGMTRKLESNAIRVRSLLSRFGLVGISVTQASDKSDKNSADSPVWLSAGDVDSSRVGLPAQADIMLGVGGNNAMIGLGQRAISICKNKAHSGPQAREGFICQFDLARSIVS